MRKEHAMEPKLIKQEDQPVLCIRTTTNTTDLYPTVDALTEQLEKHCTNFQVTPTGVVYTAYSNFENKNFDLEVGIPTDKIYPGLENILSTIIPAGTYLQAIYKGPYRKMRPFYAMLNDWLKEAGYKSGEVNYERYLNSTKDVEEEELLTEVLLPVEPI
ncbi:GyrI-like domain-containing protein [Alkalibacter rhizosphaerae]|uniref:GyrI-like domain-containing protein n=1 Tax=Alkalibacter rhizosphaerae TaxID=2815577 RepID=A0A974XJ71_9FIRM|nr:GyrI-like domain-containing protein [Alkalibacter rhizosphaerae]QSX09378.1 GyrI-like domain-containing protein [Alkalibacter rhizosphaerae]